MVTSVCLTSSLLLLNHNPSKTFSYSALRDLRTPVPRYLRNVCVKLNYAQRLKVQNI